MSADEMVIELFRIAKQNGVSNCRIARELGVSVTAVSNWKKLKKVPKMQNIVDLAKLLKCEIVLKEKNND